jgi:hypothetical protein
MRIHAYYTERMLARPPVLARLGPDAGLRGRRSKLFLRWRRRWFSSRGALTNLIRLVVGPPQPADELLVNLFHATDPDTVSE